MLRIEYLYSQKRVVLPHIPRLFKVFVDYGVFQIKPVLIRPRNTHIISNQVRPTHPAFKDLANYLDSKMCWQRRKTPAKFPDCKGKDQNNCIEFDPTHDHIQWCIPAEQRGSVCETVTPTTETSSTKRKRNCPAHR